MLKTGKLDSKILEDIVFGNIKLKRKEVLVRPGIGEDCAVIDFGGYECVMSTDPVSAAVDQIGRLAVNISCNDIASNGVEPIGIMLAVMLPEGTTEEEVGEMMKQAGEAAAELGVEIIGGHTEITHAVRQPVIVSTAIGRAPAGASRNAGRIKSGDLIYLTKWAGLEGSGILAGDRGDELAEKLSADEIDEAKSYLNLISVVREGVIAGETGFSGMHDVTEGGVLGAVWELCHTSGAGAEIWQESIPVTDVTRKICEVYKIDPLRLISSGCMMIIISPDKEETLKKKLASCDIKASLIGTVKDASCGIKLIRQGGADEIAPPGSDEIYKAIIQQKPL